MYCRLMLLGLAVALIPGCGDPTLPCGTFSFTGAPHSNSGITMSLNFDYDRSECDAASCNCDTIAWVQIVRIVDLDTGDFLSPNSQQTNRMVTGRPEATMNGWAIDRLSNRDWGYYGRNDNGSFASYVTTGSDSTDAILGDTPSGWPDQSWFDAVTVPVCIDSGSACNNKLAGYYYWLFVVSADGDAGDPFDKIGVTWMQDSFDEAVIEWDNDAPGLGKNNFPSFSKMP